MGRLNLGECALACGVAVLGLVLAVEAMTIPGGPEYARIGPQAFPLAVAGGLVIAGSLLLREALRRSAPAAGAGSSGQPTDWPALAWLVAGLLLNLALIERAGFVLASGLLFWMTARAFGSRRLVADAVTGFLLTLVAYLVFTQWLELSLPPGVLRGVF